MRQELDIASALQSSFLPEKPFLMKGDLSVSAVNISASKVGETSTILSNMRSAMSAYS
jgi:hypothetical protein